MKNTALIIGGTSGLGLELALLLSATHDVTITGRIKPKKKGLEFVRLDLDSPTLSDDIVEQGIGFEPVDLLVYAAGFYQKGRVDDLFEGDIVKMANVGLLGPIFFLNRILEKHQSLPGFIAVTSTSQWTPRLSEPVYTAVKAGLGMLANSVSLDPRVGKVLVAGPAGMRTAFWDGQGRDMSVMLDPGWVAGQIMDAFVGDFEYKFIKILRGPARTEVVEAR